MQTGFRPGGKDLGFGQVNVRIVDLLYRTRTWTRAITLLAFLSVAAFLILGGMAWLRAEGASPALLILGLAGFLALAALLLSVPLYRFGQAVEQSTKWNRGPTVASAFEHLASFWRRAGIIAALIAAFSAGGWLFVLWGARSDPRLAALVELVRHPREFSRRAKEGEQELIREEREVQRRQSPLVLEPARLGRDALSWSPTPNPPSAPGRVFTFDQIGEACPVADTSFLCLLNLPGEEIGGGSRQVLSGDDALFAVLPQTYHLSTKSYLEVTVAMEGRNLHLHLAPPEGFQLMKMKYPGTSSSGYASTPLLSFTGTSGRRCGGHGRFRVVDLSWGADGVPDHLVVDFEQDCDADPPAIGRVSVQPGG